MFLEAMQPAALGTMLEAFALMERERRDVDRHWQLRIERARYEAERAQRQYDAVEPENRSVAQSLEARWNAALETFEALKHEYGVLQRTNLLPLNDADRDNVRRLAADLPALWRAATTTMVDRKRLLRLAVSGVEKPRVSGASCLRCLARLRRRRQDHPDLRPSRYRRPSLH